MTEIDFVKFEEDSEVEWPRRGRKPNPMPQEILDALHNAYEYGTTPSLVMDTAMVKRFCTMLRKAGGMLNYRVEKVIVDDKPKKGLSTVHFRVRSLRYEESE
jgi:hypothetical protein